MIQLFFIEGKLIGSAPRSRIRIHEDITPPWSLIFYCERCGKVYAECPVIIDEATSLTSRWMAERGLCRKHSPTQMFSDIPGSIWRSWDKAFLEALPMPVLQLELERHLQAYERLENHEGETSC